jgi:ribonucleotide reductase beta subunit family protein with ferritin-like domain
MMVLGLKEAGMINRSTINVLNLKPVTRSMCSDFYEKINAQFHSPEAIRESVSWWQDNEKKLNELWWVLNYYSDSLDPEREIRAHVEHHLDSLALEKTAALDLSPDTASALEPS